MACGRAYGEGMSIAGHLRHTVRGHPHVADATIALAALAVTLLTTFAGHPAPTGNRAPAVIAAAIACVALVWRRRAPLATLVVSAVAAEVFLMQTAGGTRGALILLAPSIAFYTVADLVERRRGLIVAGVALVALAVVHAAAKPALLGPQNLAFTALGGLAIAAGDSSRNRRAYLAEVERRAARAEVERERDARRRVAEERLRIARDLHDSVGHHLALISVQSDVAAHTLDVDGAVAREALTHVKSASRKALEELRDTISLLRQPGEPATPTALPAPGLDGLADLLGSLRESGLEIEHRRDGTPVPLTPAVDLTAYRVIQESLTNVYKHSAGRRARLTILYDRRELRITIEDPGPGASETGHDTGGHGAGRHGIVGHDTGGHGIVGMDERVAALGGTFTAGPRPGGAFGVTAVLPYTTSPYRTSELARECPA